ncbi:hypothetical protein FACS1894172_14010 [Spirochaetia bacterium]|nr:hypothetical protein FACS1894164_03080 [Spirochaetia bacterium]GHU34148.1 hypothetical protein FACS1894172_14010 [Spirochaetia bacterium]
MKISRKELYRFCGYQIDMSQQHGIDFQTIILTFSPPHQREILTPTLENMGEVFSYDKVKGVRGS